MTENTFDAKSVTLIGLSGKMGAGKDEAARYLVGALNDQLGANDKNFWSRQAFADRLKLTVSTMVGGDLMNMYTEEGKNTRYPVWSNKSGRELLQEVGTQMRTLYGPNVWVDTILDTFKRHPQRWIISDVRFKNEVRSIQELGGMVIRLHGDPTGLRTNHTEAQLSHPSETDLDTYDGFDAIIDNSEFGIGGLQHKLALLFKLKGKSQRSSLY